MSLWDEYYRRESKKQSLRQALSVKLDPDVKRSYKDSISREAEIQYSMIHAHIKHGIT